MKQVKRPAGQRAWILLTKRGRPNLELVFRTRKSAVDEADFLRMASLGDFMAARCTITVDEPMPQAGRKGK